MTAVPRPGRDPARWARALKRCSALRTPDQLREYSDLCYAVRGDEGQACFQALIDSIRVRHDHGAYEATYNALWRFDAADYSAFMSRALPGFLRRMNRHGQVDRFLIGLFGPRAKKRAALFASALRELPRSQQQQVLRAMRRWAKSEEDWQGFLADHFGVARPSVGALVVPEAWPRRWRMAVADHLSGKRGLRDQWERWPRRDMAHFLAQLVAVNDLGPLWRVIGVLVTPLSTFAMPQRATFIQHLRRLPPARRARALANMKRITTGPDGAMFRALVWPQVREALAGR